MVKSLTGRGVFVENFASFLIIIVVFHLEILLLCQISTHDSLEAIPPLMNLLLETIQLLLEPTLLVHFDSLPFCELLSFSVEELRHLILVNVRLVSLQSIGFHIFDNLVLDLVIGEHLGLFHR